MNIRQVLVIIAVSILVSGCHHIFGHGHGHANYGPSMSYGVGFVDATSYSHGVGHSHHRR